MKLIANEDFRYDSRQLKCGEEFETVKDTDALVLKAAGKAREQAEPADDMAAGRKGRNRYGRRDMRPEE